RLLAILAAADVEQIGLGHLVAESDRKHVELVAARRRPRREHGDVPAVGVDVQAVRIQVADADPHAAGCPSAREHASDDSSLTSRRRSAARIRVTARASPGRTTASDDSSLTRAGASPRPANGVTPRAPSTARRGRARTRSAAAPAWPYTSGAPRARRRPV